jgi:hypothetical protein
VTCEAVALAGEGYGVGGITVYAAAASGEAGASSSSGGGLSTGALVGICVGGAVGVAIIAMGEGGGWGWRSGVRRCQATASWRGEALSGSQPPLACSWCGFCALLSIVLLRLPPSPSPAPGPRPPAAIYIAVGCHRKRSIDRAATLRTKSRREERVEQPVEESKWRQMYSARMEQSVRRAEEAAARQAVAATGPSFIETQDKMFAQQAAAAADDRHLTPSMSSKRSCEQGVWGEGGREQGG